jgi:hypothetical protein
MWLSNHNLTPAIIRFPQKNTIGGEINASHKRSFDPSKPLSACQKSPKGSSHLSAEACRENPQFLSKTHESQVSCLANAFLSPLLGIASRVQKDMYAFFVAKVQTLAKHAASRGLLFELFLSPGIVG